MELDGQRVIGDGSGIYVFEGIADAEEYELTMNARIYGSEYPVYFTLSADDVEVSVWDAKSTVDGLQAEVNGNLSDGTARLRVSGEGGEARWTLTAVGGATVAQGRVVADGSWQRLEGVRASRGIYLLTVSDGQGAKTIKLGAR